MTWRIRSVKGSPGRVEVVLEGEHATRATNELVGRDPEAPPPKWLARIADSNSERTPTPDERRDHAMDLCIPNKCPLCAKERADDDWHERHREEYSR